ncbi:hypothetical protein BO221_38330 [Archangium sp. Cb G35]|uniref:hypothetical protein n=1 Tax=Archangium sp. Cb G35 TaxID=1920190 RepID=UPI0009371E57|nr:hypothetical protein [Archangium sp. Cb G35]OJT18616.1 hypothetical protein BO221_38330 [Archangium sp. Cb G35]
MPWEIFLGNASHRLIAYIYGTRYPANVVYYNNQNIKRILQEQDIGDWSLLSEHEQDMRPDITDVSAKRLFEIKPYNEKGLQEGSLEAQTYLLVLNRTALPKHRFVAGKAFEGEILIQFAQGQYIWRLEWCTTTPGVTLYHWTRSREHFASNAAAYEAAQWVEISEQELKKYGGWVAEASDEMVERRERLTTLSGAIGVAIDVVGQVAMLVISTTTSGGERGTAPQGAKVLPFPSSPQPAAPPARLPRAAGM